MLNNMSKYATSYALKHAKSPNTSTPFGLCYLGSNNYRTEYDYKGMTLSNQEYKILIMLATKQVGNQKQHSANITRQFFYLYNKQIVYIFEVWVDKKRGYGYRYIEKTQRGQLQHI